MSDPLLVNPDGLHAASAEMNEQVRKLAAADISTPATDKASTLGAAGVAAAITSFSEAYAARVMSVGRFAETTAERYASVDRAESTRIGSASM